MGTENCHLAEKISARFEIRIGANLLKILVRNFENWQTDTHDNRVFFILNNLYAQNVTLHISAANSLCFLRFDDVHFKFLGFRLRSDERI